MHQKMERKYWFCMQSKQWKIVGDQFLTNRPIAFKDNSNVLTSKVDSLLICTEIWLNHTLWWCQVLCTCTWLSHVCSGCESKSRWLQTCSWTTRANSSWASWAIHLEASAGSGVWDYGGSASSLARSHWYDEPNKVRKMLFKSCIK